MNWTDPDRSDATPEGQRVGLLIMLASGGLSCLVAWLAWQAIAGGAP